MNLQAMFEIVINLHSNSQFDLHFLELWVSVNVCINKCTISIKDSYIWVQLQWNSCSTYDLLSVSRVLPQTCLALHCIALHCSASASARCPVWVWLLCMSGSSNLLENQGSASEGTSTMLTRRWLMDDPREHWAWPDQSGVNHLIVTIKQTKIQYII